jgi:hypothetical protein
MAGGPDAAFSLWIGNRLMAAEHGSRTRREVLALTLAALTADPAA